MIRGNDTTSLEAEIGLEVSLGAFCASYSGLICSRAPFPLALSGVAVMAAGGRVKIHWHLLQ